MSRLSLDAIRMVQAIKSTGSFSMAASILHKTPSAISYRVSSIEERLGVKLFHRNGPLISLTVEGQTLLSEGEWIINAVDSLEKRITTRSSGSDHFRIAIGSLFPLESIFTEMKEYMSIKNHIKLDIHHAIDAEEWSLLENNGMDLIVTTEQHPIHVEAQTRQLCNTQYVCCVSPDHLFATLRGSISKNMLSNDIHILQSDDLRRVGSRNLALLSGQKTLLVSSLYAQINTVKNGLGHSFLPLFTVAHHLNDGSLVIIDTELELCDETFWFAWHPGNKSRSLMWWQKKLTEKVIQPYNGVNSSTEKNNSTLEY